MRHKPEINARKLGLIRFFKGLHCWLHPAGLCTKRGNGLGRLPMCSALQLTHLGGRCPGRNFNWHQLSQLPQLRANKGTLLEANPIASRDSKTPPLIPLLGIPSDRRDLAERTPLKAPCNWTTIISPVRAPFA
jgi:hypothetical protein